MYTKGDAFCKEGGCARAGQFEVPPIGERVDRVADEAVDGAADHSAAAAPAAVPVALAPPAAPERVDRLLDARCETPDALISMLNKRNFRRESHRCHR